MVNTRILLDILLLGAVVAGPWWIAGGLVVVGVFIFPFYLEAVIAAFLFDALFAPSGFLTRGLSTAGAVLLYLGTSYGKRFVQSAKV